ncbi:hypothetical protein G6F57_021560 [Rhizopus arrhizus]|nr:hypothetical protein G6F57_021560 [Rhizopus arrhizus]
MLAGTTRSSSVRPAMAWRMQSTDRSTPVGCRPRAMSARVPWSPPPAWKPSKSSTRSSTSTSSSRRRSTSASKPAQDAAEHGGVLPVTAPAASSAATIPRVGLVMAQRVTGARPEHPMRPIPLHKHPHLAHWAALRVDGRA